MTTTTRARAMQMIREHGVSGAHELAFDALAGLRGPALDEASQVLEYVRGMIVVRDVLGEAEVARRLEA